MKREAFLRKLQNEVRDSGEPIKIEKREGKGSHYRLRWKGKITTCKSGELSPIYMNIVRKQLGII